MVETPTAETEYQAAMAAADNAEREENKVEQVLAAREKREYGVLRENVQDSRDELEEFEKQHPELLAQRVNPEVVDGKIPGDEKEHNRLLIKIEADVRRLNEFRRENMKVKESVETTWAIFGPERPLNKAG